MIWQLLVETVYHANNGAQSKQELTFKNIPELNAFMYVNYPDAERIPQPENSNYWWDATEQTEIIAKWI